MKICTLLCLVLCLTLETTGQTRLDTLLRQLDTIPPGTERQCVKLLHISKEYQRQDIDRSKDYAVRAYDVAMALEHPEMAYLANNRLAINESVQGHHVKALSLFLRNLELPQDSFSEDTRGLIHNNIGISYHHAGMYDESIKHHLLGLDFRKASGDSGEIASSLLNIGVTYLEQTNYEKASRYYREAWDYVSGLVGKNREKATILINIGELFGRQERYPEARAYYEQAIEITQKNNLKNRLLYAWLGLAEIELEDQRLGNALDYLDKTEKLARELKNGYFGMSTKRVRAALADQQGDYRKAIQLRQSAIDFLLKNGGLKALKEQTQALARSYARAGDPAEAYRQLEKAADWQDSLNRVDNRQIQENLEFKYQLRQKEHRIALLDLEKATETALRKNADLEAQAARESQWMLVLGLMAALVITGVAAYGFWQKRQDNRKLLTQKQLIEKQHATVVRQKEDLHFQKQLVEEKNREVTESIQYALRLQEAILPPPRIVKEWLTDSFLFYKPKDIVSGDFYWMETTNYQVDGRNRTLIFIAAADCTGHGVPGAMLSVVCATSLSRAINEFDLKQPGEILEKVAQLVRESFLNETIEGEVTPRVADGMDIALCALDLRDKKLFFSGANTPLYRITRRSKKLSPEEAANANDTHQLVIYRGTRAVVGGMSPEVTFETREIDLHPGDSIYIFSDGFADQFGGELGKQYRYSRFRRFLLANCQNTMEQQKQLLETEFNTWKKDHEQIDDVCVVGVRINGQERDNFTRRELEVLQHIEAGLSSKMVADKMGITKNTVDTYRKRLHAKTGTHNATELINYCLEKEII